MRREQITLLVRGLPKDLCTGSKNVVGTLNGAQCPLQTPETGESGKVLIPIRQIL